MRTFLTVTLLLASAGFVDAQGNQPNQTDTGEGQILLVFPDRTAEEFTDDMRGRIGPLASEWHAARGGVEIPFDSSDLARMFEDFVGNLQSIFNTASSVTGNYKVDQIEINVGINGEGKVTWVLGGASVGADVAVKLILRRSNP